MKSGRKSSRRRSEEELFSSADTERVLVVLVLVAFEVIKSLFDSVTDEQNMWNHFLCRSSSLWVEISFVGQTSDKKGVNIGGATFALIISINAYASIASTLITKAKG